MKLNEMKSHFFTEEGYDDWRNAGNYGPAGFVFIDPNAESAKRQEWRKLCQMTDAQFNAMHYVLQKMR